MKSNITPTQKVQNNNQESNSIASFLTRLVKSGAAGFSSVLSQFENKTLPVNSPIDSLMSAGISKGTQAVTENKNLSWLNTAQVNSTQKQSVASLKVGMGSTDVQGGETKFQEIVQEASNKYGVPTALINAVIRQESAFNPNAVSHCGAQGLMQLMPATGKAYGCNDAFDPRQNIMAGTKFLSELLTKYKGNVELSLAGYNAGPGNVAKYGNQVPPFKETQNYVVRVQKFYQDNLAKSGNSGLYATNGATDRLRG